MEACRLCGGAARVFARLAGGAYLRCEVCRLIFLEAAALPDREAEAAHYRTHQNDPDDPRYRVFLSALTGPLLARLEAGAEGLDFGCGPGPAIAPVMAEAGMRVVNYDPLFAADEALLARTYDFVTATEVVEHFHQPRTGFDQLAALIRPGGWLGVMTLFVDEATDFARWYYVGDPTHVAFYSAPTMDWIARTYGWRLESDGRRTALFQAP